MNPPLNERERTLLWALRTALSFVPTFKLYTDPLLRDCVSIQRDAAEALAEHPILKDQGDEEVEAEEVAEGGGRNVVNLREYVVRRYGGVPEQEANDD